MTKIEDCRTALRFLLADRNAQYRSFSDTVLDDGVRAAIQLGQIPGYGLTPDQTGIAPDFADPNLFALLCFKTAKLFVISAPDNYRMKTRAFSESNGGYREFITNLDRYIYRAENGSMFYGWGNLYGFLAGISGLSLLEVYTSMKVNAPFYSVTLTANGGTAGTGNNS